MILMDLFIFGDRHEMTVKDYLNASINFEDYLEVLLMIKDHPDKSTWM